MQLNFLIQHFFYPFWDHDNIHDNHSAPIWFSCEKRKQHSIEDKKFLQYPDRAINGKK